MCALLCLSGLLDARCSGRVDVLWPLDSSVLLERSFTMRVRLQGFEAGGYKLHLTLDGSPFLQAAFHYDTSEGFTLVHETDLPPGSYVLQAIVEEGDTAVASSGAV